MAFGGGREDPRRSRLSGLFSRDVGVGVPALEGEEKISPSSSFFSVGVTVPARARSGDRSGDLLPSR
jgi:hypothetical protein